MSGRRLLVVVGLLVGGLLVLPAVAAVLDGQGTENWIVPVHLTLMAALGGLAGRAVPDLAGPRATTRGAVLAGALVGLAAGVIALVVFFLLLSGLSGA